METMETNMSINHVSQSTDVNQSLNHVIQPSNGASNGANNQSLNGATHQSINETNQSITGTNTAHNPIPDNTEANSLIQTGNASESEPESDYDDADPPGAFHIPVKLPEAPGGRTSHSVVDMDLTNLTEHLSLPNFWEQGGPSVELKNALDILSQKLGSELTELTTALDKQFDYHRTQVISAVQWRLQNHHQELLKEVNTTISPLTNAVVHVQKDLSQLSKLVRDMSADITTLKQKSLHTVSVVSTSAPPTTKHATFFQAPRTNSDHTLSNALHYAS